MGKYPWFKWYPDLWFGSTRAQSLDPIARLAYVELLFRSWPDGVTEDPERWPGLVAGLSLADAYRIAPALRKLFVARDGMLFSERLEGQVGTAKARSDGAKAASAARWNADRIPERTPDRNADRYATKRRREEERAPSLRSGAGPGARRSREQEIQDRPVGLSAETWQAWVEHQWARKRPTPSALQAHRKRLALLLEKRGSAALERFVAECIEANAQGIPAWAYEAVMSGHVKGHHRAESVSEKLARELNEAGIEVEP